MAKHSRLHTLRAMLETGLVPLFYHSDVETACQAIEACLRAGVRTIEFTNRGDGAHLVFQEVARRFRADERLVLGAGSILDAGTASLYLQLGADFIVGPVLNAEVARVCNRRKVPYSPGCGTVSEISAAEELGVEIVKVFPGGQVGGPAFIKNVLGPMPWSRLMPTGGVEPKEENIRAWFDAGAACVGMGSQLLRKDLLAAGDFPAIQALAEQVLGWIRDLRQKRPLDI